MVEISVGVFHNKKIKIFTNFLLEPKRHAEPSVAVIHPAHLIKPISGGVGGVNNGLSNEVS